MLTSPTSYTRLETLAQAWLGAGATAVSVWDRRRRLRHWPAQEKPDRPDFVTPVRISESVYGEMHISGFSTPGERGWCRRVATPPHDAMETVVHQRHTAAREVAPTVPGLDIYVDSRPCIDVGGDYYDFVHQSSGSLAFSVADISGKGLRAALLMPGMHRALRSCLQSSGNSTPGSLLAQLNTDVHALFANMGGFATALLGCYEPSTRTITYVNAGHSPVIYRSITGEIHLLEADCVPVGIEKHSEPIERSLELKEGDLLLVGTDGLAEARDHCGRMFGYGKLLALVDALAHHRADEIGRRVMQQITAFSGYAPQSDDHTIMVLKGAP